MYERDDFVKIYNNTNGYEELKEYKKLLKKREAESRNILKALRQESNEELLNELKKISEEKRLLQTHIDNISNEEKAISEKDRKRTCKAIAKIMINSESYDVKKYISEIVDEIIVSNDEITLSLNIN